MNTEDFCTYEQSLLLKKLGFREECLYHYDRDLLRANSASFGSEEVDVSVVDFYTSYNLSDEYFIDTPTLAQAQKWLRKHKQYSIEVSFDKNHTPLWQSFVVRLPDVKNIKNVIFCASYEEALSAGITECLKILEI